MKKTKVISHPEFGECVELDNGAIRAVVAPSLGFSLVDFSFQGRQMLDISRKALFLSCRKGLGPLILPHFNQEGPVPRVGEDEFPHLEALKGLKVSHPFQHGVGRYAAWTFKTGSDYVEGILRGRGQA